MLILSIPRLGCEVQALKVGSAPLMYLRILKESVEATLPSASTSALLIWSAVGFWYGDSLATIWLAAWASALVITLSSLTSPIGGQGEALPVVGVGVGEGGLIGPEILGLTISIWADLLSVLPVLSLNSAH